MKKLGIVLHWRPLVEDVLPVTRLTDSEKAELVEFFRGKIQHFLNNHLGDVRNTYPQGQYFSLLQNRMNYGVRHRSCNKGEAVETIMSSFSWREPIFLCDDLHGTDGEDARVVHALGGMVIAVSDEPSELPTDDRRADLVLNSPAELGRFLLQVGTMLEH